MIRKLFGFLPTLLKPRDCMSSYRFIMLRELFINRHSIVTNDLINLHTKKETFSKYFPFDFDSFRKRNPSKPKSPKRTKMEPKMTKRWTMKMKRPKMKNTN
jgi:hypothetical protein